MKRKLSFSLAPIHVPSAADLRSLTKIYVSPKDIMGESSSPYIERRKPLSPTIEAELRAACQAFAKYNNGDEEPSKLDFELVHRYMKKETVPRQDGSSRSHKHSSDTRTQRHKNSNDARRSARRTEPTKADLHATSVPRPHIPANVGYRRDSPSPIKNPRSDKHPHARNSSSDKERRGAGDERHRLQAHYNMADSDDSADATPLTASTDAVPHPTSTGMTSLASPNREVLQEARKNTAGKELDHTRMRKELSGSRQSERRIEVVHHTVEEKRQPQPGPGAAALRESLEQQSRSASRGELGRRKSIRGEIREYFRPGSSSKGRMSRSNSRDSFRPDSGEQRPGSSAGHFWKSLSLRRKNSNGTISSRPESSRDLHDSHQDGTSPEPTKPTVDLNRKLPPLPGLDQWKGEAEIADADSKPHISQLMRTDLPKEESSAIAAGEKNSNRSKDRHREPPTSTNLLTEAAKQKKPRRSSTAPDLKEAKRMSKNKENILPVQHPTSTGFDFDALLNAMERTEIGQEWATPQLLDQNSKADSQKMSYSIKHSLDQSRTDTPNFSRKFSCEAPRRQNTAPLPTGVESTSNTKQFKGFRKVFGGLLTRKQSKYTNWTANNQRHEVPHNMNLHDEAAGAPVVRY